MKHSVSHDLGEEKARQVANRAFESYKQRFAQYKPTSNWVSDNRVEISFHVKGMSLSGALEVKPTTIDMDMEVPFLLRPFKGTALGVIEKEVRKWVGKAKAGEL
jgi:hypothetical protein